MIVYFYVLFVLHLLLLENIYDSHIYLKIQTFSSLGKNEFYTGKK